jgi:hypothetical protein
MPAVAVPGVLIALLFPAAASASAGPHHGGEPGYCRTGGAALWGDLAVCGWPGAANTGPDLTRCRGHKLAARGGGPGQAVVVSTRGAVLSCLKISGMVYVRARNVVITDTTIAANSGRLGTRANGTAGITVADGASVIVDHVTVNGEDGVHACIWDEGTRLTVNALNCYGADDGIFSWSQGPGQRLSGSNFTIANSYFHGFTHATSNGHEDGYQTEGASNGLIEHNTFELGPHANSAIAIWDSRASSRNITVTGNLITGGGFAIYAEDYNPGIGAPGTPSAGGGFVVSGVQFTGNVFSTYAAGCVGKYGVWFTRPRWAPYHGGPTDGWHRSGNRVLETGESIDAGNPHDGSELCR